MGGGHSKDGERFVRLCRHYAAQTGLAVACIDAVDHGERRPVGASGDVPRGWHSRASAQMVTDWLAVVDELSSVGPPVAYVGFSMGAVFGFPTVAALPTVSAAVFVVGGIPGDSWTDDPDLASGLTPAAAQLGHANVLMLNKDADDLFPAAGVSQLFDATVAISKQIDFLPGDHDEWGPELIARSTTFLVEHTENRGDVTGLP